jgi:hypothetical protein
MALQRSEFPYPEPAHADVYPLIFPGPIRFVAASHGPAQARLWFDPSYLALPIRRDEKALRLMLQRAGFSFIEVWPYGQSRYADLCGVEVRGGSQNEDFAIEGVK